MKVPIGGGVGRETMFPPIEAGGPRDAEDGVGVPPVKEKNCTPLFGAAIKILRNHNKILPEPDCSKFIGNCPRTFLFSAVSRPFVGGINTPLEGSD